ncbi:hypothetical protein N798_11485 [Knoellia flava TL1]|uniref:Uncharacterized protein n=2 Tax=Knoellia flava TaxID=913969 RepID=A0A8H9KTA1_9MICO|nr:hypothetical protein [Knoellia flava]KGN30109.1 hypothetical protein N798_11485 [Knoellia flava TL1]GGB72616.1 hypothetical protein GCM10011314_10120 [Knoellia flava]
MSDPILELLAAPPSPAMSVDEDAVHTGGRRRLRRRNLRRAGVGAGAAVAAAAIAFTTLGSGLGGEALPAGPSTSVDAGRRVSAALFDGDWSVEVRPGAPADQPNVMFYKGSGTSRQQLAGSSADATVVSMGTGTGADGVMLGTAPADAEQFLTVTRDGTTGGVEQDTKPLPGTDYQAIALRFEVPAQTENYVDTFWTNAVDEVRSARGELLPSVPTNDGDRFFLAREAGTMGVFMADGSGGSTRPLTTGESTTMGYGQKPDGGAWSWSSVTLLPEGARDVRLEWANASRTTDVTVRSLGTAEVAFAKASGPGAGSGPIVTTVSWTDTAGTRHTEAVE